MENRLQIWILVVLLVIIAPLIIVGGVYLNGKKAVTPAAPQTTVPALSESDHVRGASASSTVTLIEYGDFQCPACGQYEPLVQQLEKDYDGRVAFAFRNFPLYQLHPNAIGAAYAAEAAGLQGKYWEMHDLLYKNQTGWADTAPSTVAAKFFVPYAQSLGLDTTKFEADMKSDAVAARVKADQATGAAAQIDHTPTFFLNTVQITNPASYEAFKSVLDAALASSTAR